MLTIISNYDNLIINTSAKDRKNIKIYLGMSGGVDSSVTAYLLKKEGFDVKGIYMQCWGSDDPNCRANVDRADALKVASYLKIPIEVWNFEKEYKDKVIKYFYKEYKKGNTPNPDILCNSEIKFDLFLKKAIKEGADYIATGHYAKVVSFDSTNINLLKSKNIKYIKNEKNNIGYSTSYKSNVSNINIQSLTSKTNYRSNTLTYKGRLEGVVYDFFDNSYIASGKDMWKDQSYFLSKVNSSIMSKIIFPLGSLIKSNKNTNKNISTTVRRIASSIKIPVAEKKDSTGICFLEDINTEEFLKKKISEKKGKVLNLKNEVIGYHYGATYYTIGQRKKFVITKYQGIPLYVIDKDVTKNILYVGSEKDLYRNIFKIKDLNFTLNKNIIKEQIKNKSLFVRVRNLGEFYLVKNIDFDTGTVYTKEKIRAIAPGQFAVFYFININFVNEKLIIGSFEILK